MVFSAAHADGAAVSSSKTADSASAIPLCMRFMLFLLGMFLVSRLHHCRDLSVDDTMHRGVHNTADPSPHPAADIDRAAAEQT